MKIVYRTLVLSFIVIALLACSEQKHEVVKEAEVKADKRMSEHSIGEAPTSELVRLGTIDVESIDVNKDGKIYECPMDWNVLNDSKGDCPVCGMDLEEYSLADIKVNLDKYGYEYKK